MATLKTYYVVSTSDWKNTHFSMQLSELDDINTDCSEQELVRQVRAIWRKHSATTLEELSIRPIRSFEIFDNDTEEKYLLEISMKQQRSKKEDFILSVGGRYNCKKVIKWQEPVEEA